MNNRIEENKDSGTCQDETPVAETPKIILMAPDGTKLEVSPDDQIIIMRSGETEGDILTYYDLMDFPVKREENRSNCFSHARQELKILSASATDPTIRPIIEQFTPQILELVHKFGKSRQSGGSAPMTASALSGAVRKLCLFETIAPLTGEDDEWTDVSARSNGVPMFQNNRCSAVFKDGKDGRAYYLDAIHKKNQAGGIWSGSFWLSKEDYLTGNKELMIDKRGYIKSFPFTPKTFVVDVIEEMVAPDDWEMYMVDPKQLDTVWEYYDKF